MSSFQIIQEIFWAVLGPWMILGTSASYLPGALLNLVRTEGVASLLHWSHVKTAWFSALWSFMGREIRQENGPQVTALLQGRVSQGAIVDEPQTQPLSGVVLEIGPGVGYWVDIFSAFNNPADEKATKSGTSGKLKIYGVEPNRHAHPQLKEHIKAAGLEDVYEILPVGIQSILKEDNKISEGSVDCIVTLLCLCSIPEPEENIRTLYKLLKPGGRWYLDEHVRVKRSIFFGWYQCKFIIDCVGFFPNSKLFRRYDQLHLACFHWRLSALSRHRNKSQTSWQVDDHRPSPACGRALVSHYSACVGCTD